MDLKKSRDLHQNGAVFQVWELNNLELFSSSLPGFNWVLIVAPDGTGGK